MIVFPVQTARHQRHGPKAVLPGQVLTEPQTGDFGKSVSFIGRLRRSGKQGIFPERLDGVTRINTVACKEAELFYSVLPRRRNHIVLDLKIFQQEFRHVIPVRRNPADFRRGKNHILRPRFPDKPFHGGSIAELQFRMGPQYQIFISLSGKFP